MTSSPYGAKRPAVLHEEPIIGRLAALADSGRELAQEAREEAGRLLDFADRQDALIEHLDRPASLDDASTLTLPKIVIPKHNGGAE